MARALFNTSSNNNTTQQQQQQQQRVLPPLPKHDCSDGAKHRECCYSPSNDNSGQSSIPLEILVDHVAPFFDRTTYNSCLLLCRRAHHILTTSWWRQIQIPSQQELPPWPRKLVARDPSCRVRCLTFSDDHLLLACGCSDGKIRSWDVRTGELRRPLAGRGRGCCGLQ